MNEDMIKEITQLTITVAHIPEMREDIKELIRAIKGNNGNLGLSARQATLEKSVESLDGRMRHFENSCEYHRKETNKIINERFDTLLNQLNKISYKKLDELVEKGRINEDEAREIRRDKRKFEFEFKKDYRVFLYGLTAGFIPKLIELLIGLFS